MPRGRAILRPISFTGDKMGNSRRVVPRKRGRRRQKGDAKRALQGVRRLASLVIQPKQYLDTTLSGTFATAWTFVNISAMAEGDDLGTRDGREISVTRITIRGGLVTGSTGTTPNRFRLIVFRDNENTGTVPDDSDVFVGATPGVDALRNFGTQNMERFTFLWDKYITCDRYAAPPYVATVATNYTVNSSANNKAFQFDKKVAYRIQYTGNLSTDEGRGATYFGYCADSVAGFSPIFTAYSRLWYQE